MFAEKLFVSAAKKYISVSLLMLTAVACSDLLSAGDEKIAEPEKKSLELRRAKVNVVEELRAIVEGDPVNDANEALARGNRKLWVYSNRSVMTVPGIQSKDQANLDQGSLQTAPGMGDTVYGEEHMELRKKFLEYAERYNLTVWNER